MNEQERIKLLKEVVRVAPEEMGAILKDGPYVLFDAASRALDLHQPPLSGDDGDACFVMLDAMENAGKYWILSTHVEDGVRRYCVWEGWDDDYPAISGATSKAEAIVRAFISYFQTQESPRPE